MAWAWRNSSASATYFVTLLEDIKLADSRLKASTDANTAYTDAWASAPPTTWHSTVVKHIKNPSLDVARIWMPMTGQ